MLDFLARSIENGKFCISVGYNVYNVCCRVGVDAEVFGNVAFNTCWNVFLSSEELIDFSCVVDVVVGIIIPSVYSAVYLYENGLVSGFFILVSVLLESKSVVFGVFEIINDWFSAALVVVAPSFYKGFCAKTYWYCNTIEVEIVSSEVP